jgi:hypothetical protein
MPLTSISLPAEWYVIVILYETRNQQTPMQLGIPLKTEENPGGPVTDILHPSFIFPQIR